MYLRLIILGNSRFCVPIPLQQYTQGFSLTQLDLKLCAYDCHYNHILQTISVTVAFDNSSHFYKI